MCTHLIHGSVDQSDSVSEIAFQSMQLFCTAYDRESPYFTMDHHFPPLKIAPSCGEIWTPANTWFLRPTRVRTPNNISISSADFLFAQREIFATILPLSIGLKIHNSMNLQCMYGLAGNKAELLR